MLTRQQLIEINRRADQVNAIWESHGPAIQRALAHLSPHLPALQDAAARVKEAEPEILRVTAFANSPAGKAAIEQERKRLQSRRVKRDPKE